MRPELQYVFEMLLCGGIFVLLYKGILERRASWRACRLYLIISTVASVVIPLLEIPIWPSETVFVQLPLVSEAPAPEQDASVQYYYNAKPTVVSWVVAAYAVIVSFSLSFNAAKIMRISSLRKQAKVTDKGDYFLAESEFVKSPFSFLDTIFICLNLEKQEREIIICHERSHVRHNHSMERIFMSLMTSVFWINPFIRMSARYMEEVQEWEADSDVIAEGCDITLYRMTIFKQLFGYYPEMSCGLKDSFTKKRFEMMDVKRKRFGVIRLAAALCLVAGTGFVFGATAKSPQKEQSVNGDVKQEFIHAETVEAKRMTVNVTDKGNTITIDGVLIVDNDFKYLPVQIKADPDVPMGVITDIKQKLRSLGLTQVEYMVNDGSASESDKPVTQISVYGKSGEGISLDELFGVSMVTAEDGPRFYKTKVSEEPVNTVIKARIKN